MSLKLHFSPAVKTALQTGKPIVALESTIIAHGMPWPQNLETAQSLENIIRNKGAVPATIAILEGKLHIDLSEKELTYLAQAEQVLKASRRDLGIIMSKGLTAATTVAATMIGAHRAGIRVFATGGIGGVHRGATETFDISADLQELAQTPVAVVSAGAKAILDLPMTLEYLETMGVPVIGVDTDEFPAFYTRASGLPIPYRLDTAKEIAAACHSHWNLGLENGILIANPIPHKDSIPSEQIFPIIEKAVVEAEARQISGKALTPYLLNRIKELSDGQSLVSNIALVRQNAALAADLSTALLAEK